MQPFELPDFYLVHPARLNPHVEGTRAHSTQWARCMGMLDDTRDPGTPEIWDEEKLAEMDYALLCAYTHPDCASPELDLITDWYVWVFYFDDHFLEVYKKPRDQEGARAYLDRLCSFMGPEPPEPENAAERGLPALCEEHGLDEEAREILDGYVTDLWNWTAGILKWHRATSRYREADLRERYSGRRSGASAEPVRFVLPGPNGLGTSATRIRLPLPAGPGRGGR